MSDFHKCIQGNPIISCPPVVPRETGGVVAYGSLYGTDSPIEAITGNKVDFEVPGPFSGTIPDVVNDQITVLSDGVYTIHMDITASLLKLSTDLFAAEVSFRLYINDMNVVPESEFESRLSIGSTEEESVQTRNTVGRTIQRRLNAGDRLSIRIEFASGGGRAVYQLPSLVVTKIAP
ncbi:hypothetical protein [Aneurinibacillus migulanus]|uniref:hypothetical protein n=1 Tax=Aneurinibacillus migulanus TaxID=47500 RepID=UPI000697B9D3|nr:hypothetical protein [Aneurinibacillus migulanus]